MSDMAEDLPREIGRGTVDLAPGLTIEVVTLDNGMSVIIEDSIEALLNWLEDGNAVEGKR